MCENRPKHGGVCTRSLLVILSDRKRASLLPNPPVIPGGTAHRGTDQCRSCRWAYAQEWWGSDTGGGSAGGERSVSTLLIAAPILHLKPSIV